MASPSPQEIVSPVRTKLQRFVAAGHLRYWIIASWALALVTEAPLNHVLIWFTATMAAGALRSLVERRSRRPWTLTGVAMVSCLVWAAAPLLAWLEGGAHGATLAAILLCSGYFLVFTQKRAAPREALVVSAPYTAVSAWLIATAWGGESFWTLVACVPVLGLAMLIKVLITQIKDGELQGAIDQQRYLIRELEDARDQANAANEAKSNFLAVVSHELRTPMNGVLGAAQLLEMARLPAPASEYVSIIRGSGEGLLALLNDILDVTKIEAGKLELHPHDVAMEDLERSIIGPFQAQAEAKGLAFEFTSTNLPPAVRADPLRLGQVVQNLLSNAIKFTSAGRIGLDITGKPTPDERCELTFTVTDTGAGIADADLGRLFQPFSQVDASSTRSFGGTGLGLAIARRLARQMNGDVLVKSELGTGSVFVFTAVVDPIQAGQELAESAPSRSLQSGLRILVVEDHAVNRMVLQAWLGTQGLDCSVAEDGERAIALASQTQFDLILMDVNMPVMDGLTATRVLRRTSGPNQRTPIAILSASARREDLDVGLAAGANAYLTKPIDFEAVLDLLERCGEGRLAAA